MKIPSPTRTARWLPPAPAAVAVVGVAICVALITRAAPEHGHDHAHGHDAHAQDSHAHDAKGDAAEEGHADEVKLTPEAIRRHRVRADPVKRRELRASFVAPARVSFNEDAVAHVGSAVKGRVIDLKARVGDAVKKDDVLVVLDSAELGEAQLDFLQKKTAADVAGPLLDAARSALERGRKLYEQSQGIALADLQRRETEFKTAEANARTSQTAAVAAEGRLRLHGMDPVSIEQLAKSGEIKPQFIIRAPISGRVTEREVTLGELVGPEEEHLLVVADMTRLWVLADVPEARLKGLKPNAEARLTLAAMPDEKVSGVVDFISHSVDPATRTARVRIEVDNKDGELRPGMFGSVEIVGGGDATGQAVLAVPDEAVQTVEGGPAVFVPVEGEENTFAKRAVTVAKPVGGWVPVLSGLKEGESVVVSGTFILKADLGKSGAAHEH